MSTTAEALHVDRLALEHPHGTALPVPGGHGTELSHGHGVALGLPPERPMPLAERVLAGIVFSSRWMQAPLYVGLIIAQAIYVVVFVKQLWDLIISLATSEDETTIMIGVLSLIDVVMISNLLVMVIIGGYETFVSRLRVQNHPDRPEWLTHINANTMKIKLSLALIGISSIHLLKSFISTGDYSQSELVWKTAIHCVFLLSAIALAYTAVMSNKVVVHPGHT